MYQAYIFDLDGTLANSIEDIARAKAEIFENLKDSGFGIINADSAYHSILHAQAVQYCGQTLTFGNTTQSDCQIINIEQSANTDKVVHIHCMGRNIKQKFDKDVGEHLIKNSLAVFTCLTLL